MHKLEPLQRQFGFDIDRKITERVIKVVALAVSLDNVRQFRVVDVVDLDVLVRRIILGKRNKLTGSRVSGVTPLRSSH